MELRPETSDFLGGYIHNLYNEKTKVTVTAKLSDAKRVPKKAANCENVQKTAPEAPDKRRYTEYSTALVIPFIEWPNMSMCYGYDELVELCFKDVNEVESVRVSINGREIPVLAHSQRGPDPPCSDPALCRGRRF